jgi:HAD superfamily hydrolase (TIGR01509 family)
MTDSDLLIFDCDGVLIDSEVLAIRADVACFAEHGVRISAEEIYTRYTGMSVAAMIADVQERFDVRLAESFSETLAARVRECFEAELEAIRGIDTLLDNLPGRRCVASSSTPSRLEHSLRLVGLHSRFAPHIFSATQVARGKPAPDLFLFAAAQMRCAPHRCIVIEDSVAGVMAAKAAGMTAMGFCGGSHCTSGHYARLLEAGADAVFDDLGGLASALK